MIENPAAPDVMDAAGFALLIEPLIRPRREIGELHRLLFIEDRGIGKIGGLAER